MRERMIKVASLLMAGTLIFSAAYTQNKMKVEANEVTANTRTVTAGVSSELAEQLEGMVSLDVNVTSGVTNTVGGYLLEVAAMTMDDVNVTETDTVTTAAGQAAAFGYTNLGVEQLKRFPTQ